MRRDLLADRTHGVQARPRIKRERAMRFALATLVLIVAFPATALTRPLISKADPGSGIGASCASIDPEFEIEFCIGVEREIPEVPAAPFCGPRSAPLSQPGPANRVALQRTSYEPGGIVQDVYLTSAGGCS